ncbi:hypothetical protein [Endozoicomonas sp. 8E]|uniref:hypothetical protein n=1 Tax=Endozoicomonas sp. 8E TaxID=3035692 RepID=UPI0029395205|nr:hypothetical protein [Endozoicomonas sp. 8E]WOG28595.1 hypothetical protein P6910_02760 [Endozoicomonas sp. 8E]
MTDFAATARTVRYESQFVNKNLVPALQLLCSPHKQKATWESSMSLEARVTVVEEEQKRWLKVTASLGDSLSFLLHFHQELKRHLTIHDRKFASVGQRFDKVDQRFVKVETYLEDHDRRFDNMEDLLMQSLNKLEDHDRRFNKQEDLLMQIYDNLEDHDQRFDKMDQRFDKMDQRFGKMDQRFDKMDQRFDKMDQRFGNMEDMLTQISSKLA